MKADRTLCQGSRSGRWPRSRGTAMLLALVTAGVLGAVLLLAATDAHARPDGQAVDYQVTLKVGTGLVYSLPQGNNVVLPISATVTGGMQLAASTVLVEYNPLQLRPVACTRQEGAPGGYCNIGWDPARGLVRFNILAAAGLPLDQEVLLYLLTFEPASTAKENVTSAVTPLLESISDVQGNYMTSLLLGSSVRLLPSGVVGASVWVGGQNGPNPIRITPQLTATVPIEVTGVTGLGSASFSLSFDPQVVQPLACRPVELADAFGACALHADHVSANLVSGTGLTGAFTVFEVVFTTGPTAGFKDTSNLNLMLGAFADTAGKPITVRAVNNSFTVDRSTNVTVPVLRMGQVAYSLPDDQRIDVELYLDNGAALAAGSWGLRYDPTIVEAEACNLFPDLPDPPPGDPFPAPDGFCNATGQAGLVRMTVLGAAGTMPPHIATVTFRRHPLAKAQQTTNLTYEITNFADAAYDQLAYRTLDSSITILQTLGSPPAVSMQLLGAPVQNLYKLPQGGFLDFSIHFEIDPTRPIVNLSGSIHYDPRVLRPTQCQVSGEGSGAVGHCNTEYDQDNGVIRFNLLSNAGVSGSLTPFVFRVEAASTSKAGDKSPLHFTVEAINGWDDSGQELVPRTWVATDTDVSVKTALNNWRVVVGPPPPIEAPVTAVYTITMGFTETVPIWVAVPSTTLAPPPNDPQHLGAATVEVRYDSAIARATGCRLRTDFAPDLDGGYCTLLPGAVRAAFVSTAGIYADTHVLDIDFAQAPNAVPGQTTALKPVVDNFVDVNEVPIPTTVLSGWAPIGCYAAPVEDLHIARDGDNLVLTWSHVGGRTSSYQVWRAEENAYFAFTDTLYSTAIEGTVPAPVVAGAGVSFIDTVGVTDPLSGLVTGPWADDLNHYYMVRSMCATDQGSLRSNRVGKYTRMLSPGWNLVSWPLLIYNEALDAVLGTQLYGTDSPDTADRVLIWDPAAQSYDSAWYCGGSICGAAGEPWAYHWLSNDYSQSPLALPPDIGFWIQNLSGGSEILKIVGAVEEGARTVPIAQNWTLLGSAFPPIPSNRSLEAAKLPAVGTDSPDSADRVLVWDEAMQVYRSAWFCGGPLCPEPFTSHWLANDYSWSDLVLQPGQGFWFQKRFEPRTWINSR